MEIVVVVDFGVSDLKIKKTTIMAFSRWPLTTVP